MGIRDNFTEAGKAAGSAMFKGGQMAAAHKANRMIIKAVRKAFGDSYPEMISETPVGKAMEQIALPFVIITLCKSYPDQIPQVERVLAAAELALQAGTLTAGMPLLDQIDPLIEELASVGKNIDRQFSALPDGSKVEEEVKEKDKVR